MPSLAELAAVLRQYPSGPWAPVPSKVEPVVTLLGVVLLAFTLAAMPLVMRLFSWIAGIDPSTAPSAPRSRPAWGFVQIAAVVAWIVFFSLAMHFVLPREEHDEP